MEEAEDSESCSDSDELEEELEDELEDLGFDEDDLKVLLFAWGDVLFWGSKWFQVK